VTFDPVPLYIICMRLGPSIPGVYVNPGFWIPKIRVLQFSSQVSQWRGEVTAVTSALSTEERVSG
jgi:hypothetical protein